jgi:tRNA U34 5-methylaminomethyl-2-thiouridine-forming methyltransferase MnmC
MKHERITTKDGSISYINKKYQEAYHSFHGAFTEALEKHVQACKIPELSENTQSLKILDVCFGLGYNSLVCIQEALKRNSHIKIKIDALENDNEVFKMLKECHPQKDLKLIEDHCIFHMGDARETIVKLKNNDYDAIFFDPFSPKVCPELWQENFIQEVVNKAKAGAYISTYSSSRLAKDGFSKAGCELLEGPKCGRKTGGVLAKRINRYER